MKDWEISGKPRNLCCFEFISFAILFGLFSPWFVNSSQAKTISNINTKWQRERNHTFLRLPGLSCKATATKTAKM